MQSLMVAVFIKLLLIVHIIVCSMIILIVLMQRPKSEGLGSAIGGATMDVIFGGEGTKVLQTITRWLGGIFFAAALLLSILYVREGSMRSPIQEKLQAPTHIPAK